MKNKLLVTLSIFLAISAFAEWKPKENSLTTEWGEAVTPDNVWQEYPRPQFERSGWLNLNGLWEYSILKKNQPQPKEFKGDILVPFCVESSLSGVKGEVMPDDRIWYRREFEVPRDWKGKSVLLNFEAVDYESTVWVNGMLVGSHKGGFDRFTFDITVYLKESGKQEVVVSVDDPSSFGTQPRGKQQIPAQGIWYTPVSGIWQTVWLEAVSEDSWLKEVKLIPDIDQESITVIPFSNKPLLPEYQVKVKILDDKEVIAEGQVTPNYKISLDVKNPKLWSPDNPRLYDVQLVLTDPSGKVLDEVSSYFGMRKISVGIHKGNQYLFLNNEPLFHYGTLDQGWWPDGLHTPPSDEAMKYDIEITKEMGFNMIRKHIKVEPDRWYYHCDKLGILVWQDMPAAMAVLPKGGLQKPHHLQHVWRRTPEELNFPSDDAAQYEWEMSRMINLHYNSPAIVMWVPFNEGMGQYSTCRIADMVKQLDPTRLVNAVSGWKLYPCGDVLDIHTYDETLTLPPAPIDRASVIGEFGGIGYPVKNHLWNPERKNWGYQTYQSEEELIQAYRHKFDQIVEMQKAMGLSAAVYTQITDVEIEVNGLITYDRKVIKIPVETLSEIHSKLFE